jgi:hypothetical protein
MAASFMNGGYLVTLLVKLGVMAAMASILARSKRFQSAC